MRFIKQKKKSRNWTDGATVIKKFFAFFPITIGDETRWFERVEVEYLHYSSTTFDDGTTFYLKPNRFIN